jgi:hypothetical protein
MICTPNAKFLSVVPAEILSILDKELETWNFKDTRDFQQQRVFDKFKSIVYKVSEYSRSDRPSKNIEEVLNWCETLFPGKVPIWANLFAMYPGQRYPIHVDGLELHLESNRIHIPIIFEPGAQMVFFNKTNDQWIEERHDLHRGGAWEINNINPHSAENLSSFWRVNFVVDMIDKELMNSRKDWIKDNGKQMMIFWNLENEFKKNNEFKKWSYDEVKSYNLDCISKLTL